MKYMRIISIICFSIISLSGTNKLITSNVITHSSPLPNVRPDNPPYPSNIGRRITSMVDDRQIKLFIPLVSGPGCTYFFVDSVNGKDSNPGNFDYPFKTIQYAVDNVQPCDSVYIRKGTYFESVRINKSGLPGEPITLSAFPGEIVEINGGSMPAISAFGNDLNREFWIIEDLTLRSTGYQTILLGWWHQLYSINNFVIRNSLINGGILIRGHHNIIENNTIDGTGNTYKSLAGLEAIEEVSHHNTFRYNHIQNINTLYGRGIWLLYRTHDNLIEGNQIKNITGERGQCIDVDGYQNVQWQHKIIKNTAINCGAIGIQLENTFDTLVENNTIRMATRGGIVIINYGGSGNTKPDCQFGGENNQYGADGDCRGRITDNILRQNIISGGKYVGGIISYASAGVKVYSNIVYGGQTTALYLSEGINYSHSWDVRGNIFANNSRSEISVVDAKSLLFDDYNLLYHPMDENRVYQLHSGMSGFFSLDEWKIRYSLAKNSIQSNPLFLDLGELNFHLNKESPAVDNGIFLGSSVDFDAKSRPLGSNYDIGPYEQ